MKANVKANWKANPDNGKGFALQFAFDFAFCRLLLQPGCLSSLLLLLLSGLPRQPGLLSSTRLLVLLRFAHPLRGFLN